MEIKGQCKVTMHYKLSLDSGEVVQSSFDGDPVAFEYGQGQLIPGLEKQMEGLKDGDEKSVQVSPEEGYGEANPDAIIKVPRSEIPVDGPLEEGMMFQVQSQTGQVMLARVAGLTDEEVTMDLIREKFADEVDGDPDTDKPLADLYGMEEADWRTTAEICLDPEEAEYNGYTEDCAALMELDHALEANLTDIRSFYFGRVGGPDWVDGVAVSIIIVGRTPGGKLAGVRTITIWT